MHSIEALVWGVELASRHHRALVRSETRHSSYTMKRLIRWLCVCFLLCGTSGLLYYLIAEFLIIFVRLPTPPSPPPCSAGYYSWKHGYGGAVDVLCCGKNPFSVTVFRWIMYDFFGRNFSVCVFAGSWEPIFHSWRYRQCAHLGLCW